MPTKPLKRCSKVFCDAKVMREGYAYCAEHTREMHTRHNGRRVVDQRYQSAAWKRLRSHKVALNPLCENCLKNDRATPVAEVDHIQPIKNGGDFFSLRNLQSLCKTCHSIKTSAERKGRGV